MKYIIIGLGNYGGLIAEELTNLGHEVIGVDKDESRVEQLKDKMATSFILDATDSEALAILPLRSVDVVIVAIGENFGASVKAVALLKKSQVKHIYARAIDDVHRNVLEAFDLDSILSPEKEAARQLVQILDLKVAVESFRVDKSHYIIKFNTPKSLCGYTLGTVGLESQFKLKVITIIKATTSKNSIGATTLDRNVDNSLDPK